MAIEVERITNMDFVRFLFKEIADVKIERMVKDAAFLKGEMLQVMVAGAGTWGALLLMGRKTGNSAAYMSWIGAPDLEAALIKTEQWIRGAESPATARTPEGIVRYYFDEISSHGASVVPYRMLALEETEADREETESPPSLH